MVVKNSIWSILLLVMQIFYYDCEGNLRTNNVCKAMEDYATISRNPSCWYDRDVNAPPNQIAKNHGFPFEFHQIRSPDGFILTLFRIPHNGSNSDSSRAPIILHHGILLDGLSFMMLGSNSSAFVLSRRGFDVWLVNTRGSLYSGQHLKYTPFDKRYWDFSFHEMGTYDLPAIINYVAKTTKQKGEITLLGYSMGSTSAFIYASTYPNHAKKNVKAIIGLAPVAYMKNTNPIFKSLALNQDLIMRILGEVLDYGFGPNFPTTTILAGRICNVYPMIVFCKIVISLLVGTNRGETQASVWPLFFSHAPSGLSFKCLKHYSQLIRNPEEGFKAMDYGSAKNLEIYKSPKPPLYDLSQINIPVHLFYGKNDLIASETDIMRLYDVLTTKKTVMSVFEDEGRNLYNHLDFQLGKNSPKIFNTIADYAQR